MSGLLDGIRSVVRRAGFDVIRFRPGSHALARRQRLFEHYAVDLVFDVGANEGQYATELRELGYRGRIVSFEPLAVAFATLSAAARADSCWDVVRTAVGDKPGRATMQVAGNLASSSLLPMLERHVRSAPESAVVSVEEVDVETVATLFERYRGDAERPLLKIDTQGYERRVLEGAGRALDQFLGVQLEMSLVPLYRGEALLAELLTLLDRRGFTLVSLEPGYTDPATGQLLQTDGLFFRI
jgi:FkbM family methyltransferase